MKQPTPSNILIKLMTGDSRLWPGFEIEEMTWTGESAESEADAGMLDEAIAPMFQPERTGMFYLYNFQAYYTKDYYGEVDAEFTLEGWREAAEDDKKEFYDAAGTGTAEADHD